MTSQPEPYREVEGPETCSINSICYSPTDEFICIAYDSAQPHIIDKEGRKVLVFIKGNSYLLNQKVSPGHVSYVTSCHWHPKETQVYYLATDRLSSLVHMTVL